MQSGGSGCGIAINDDGDYSVGGAYVEGRNIRMVLNNIYNGRRV